MDNYTIASNNYNVLPIKVQNSNAPWIEICKKWEPYDYIVLEPVVAKDPLDINEPLPIFNSENASEPDQIYGSYVATRIEYKDENYTQTIIRASIACLKNSSSLKHAQMSTFIATSDMFRYLYNEKDMNETMVEMPRIILNTKCDSKYAPLNSFSEIVREITAASINCFGVYPTIFVAFSDDSSLTEDYEEEKKSKKKKKKKKNKKDKKK